MKKKILISIIVILILAICLLLFVFPKNKRNKGVGTAGISKKEFDEIVIGKTTQFELNKIIDNNDEWENDDIYAKCVEEISKSKEDKKYIYTYKYYGENGGYAIITLQADYSNGYFYNDVIVTKKENFGLK